MASRLARMAREPETPLCLPYARHLDERILVLDGAGLMACLRLEGASFETADIADLNARHARLNNTWRNIARDRLAVWHHLVRRPALDDLGGGLKTPFAQSLDRAYAGRLHERKLYRNELFLTLVLRPDIEDPITRFLRRPARRDVELMLAARELGEIVRDVTQHLARYAPQPLGLYRRNGLWFSEPLEMLRLLLGADPGPAPLVKGHLGRSIYTDRIIFGRETLEIRRAESSRFGAILGVKEYPATTRTGMWDGLLSAPFPFVLSQSFCFLSKAAARGVLERKQNQMVSARDRAASQIGELDTALDDLTSNRFVMGEHQASLLVLSDTAHGLARPLAEGRAIMADSGLVAAREDLGLEGAYWAQFPGVFSRRTRPAAITSLNFSALAPFNTYPCGRPSQNHWGEALAMLTTPARSPFYFNFHVADLGHTFICGPSGSGKTVIQNFLLSQLEKHHAQQILIDKDRGSEIFVRARGGRYLTLRRGQPSGLAPLRALRFTPSDKVFLGSLVRKMVCPGDQTPSPAEARAIDAAIESLAPLPPGERSFSALRVLLGQQDGQGVGARLERWISGGALGWALDGTHDELCLEEPLLGLDVTEFLDQPEVRTPVMMYLLHRIYSVVDGRRLVIDIDEFWRALGDEAFRALAQDGLKTFRKQNAFMVFGTQSPADVLASPIAHTIVEMCATKIFLPNPAASEHDYREGFGLSGEEFRLVREGMTPSGRQFLVKQGHDSVVAELDLGGLDDHLAVLSGRAETIALMEAVRGEGSADDSWLRAFHSARRTAP